MVGHGRVQPVEAAVEHQLWKTPAFRTVETGRRQLHEEKEKLILEFEA